MSSVSIEHYACDYCGAKAESTVEGWGPKGWLWIAPNSRAQDIDTEGKDICPKCVKEKGL